MHKLFSGIGLFTLLAFSYAQFNGLSAFGSDEQKREPGRGGSYSSRTYHK